VSNFSWPERMILEDALLKSIRAYHQSQLTTPTEEWRRFFQTSIDETYAVYRKLGGAYSLAEMVGLRHFGEPRNPLGQIDNGQLTRRQHEHKTCRAGSKRSQVTLRGWRLSPFSFFAENEHRLRTSFD
jgi:hypothetical protein